MRDDIKKLLEFNENADYKRLSVDEILLLRKYVIDLQRQKDKFRLRCFNALKYIRDNYCILDSLQIDLLDDILCGVDD